MSVRPSPLALPVAIFLVLCVCVLPARSSAAPEPAAATMVKDFTERATDSERRGAVGDAVQLLRAAAELDPSSVDVSVSLADAWNLAFQYDMATAEYRRALTLTGDPSRRTEISSEITRLTSSATPLEEGRSGPLPALPDDARRAFALGESLRRKGDDAGAVRAYQAALLLDDSLPGPYRALGGEYEKLGDTVHERQFFDRYLSMRSTGPIAEDIRRRLAKAGALGTLQITSSFPCEVWLNDQDLGRKTPIPHFRVPEGPVKVTCDLTEDLHSAFTQHPVVIAGKTSTVSFGVAVLKVALDPWARVLVDGRDIGLYDETAIRTGHHTIALIAYDGSRRKQVAVDLAPGQTYAITSW